MKLFGGKKPHHGPHHIALVEARMGIEEQFSSDDSSGMYSAEIIHAPSQMDQKVRDALIRRQQHMGRFDKQNQKQQRQLLRDEENGSLRINAQDEHLASKLGVAPTNAAASQSDVNDRAHTNIKGKANARANAKASANANTAIVANLKAVSFPETIDPRSRSIISSEFDDSTVGGDEGYEITASRPPAVRGWKKCIKQLSCSASKRERKLEQQRQFSDTMVVDLFSIDNESLKPTNIPVDEEDPPTRSCTPRIRLGPAFSGNSNHGRMNKNVSNHSSSNVGNGKTASGRSNQAAGTSSASPPPPESPSRQVLITVKEGKNLVSASQVTPSRSDNKVYSSSTKIYSLDKLPNFNTLSDKNAATGSKPGEKRLQVRDLTSQKRGISFPSMRVLSMRKPKQQQAQHDDKPSEQQQPQQSQQQQQHQQHHPHVTITTQRAARWLAGIESGGYRKEDYENSAGQHGKNDADFDNDDSAFFDNRHHNSEEYDEDDTESWNSYTTDGKDDGTSYTFFTDYTGTTGNQTNGTGYSTDTTDGTEGSSSSSGATGMENGQEDGTSPHRSGRSRYDNEQLYLEEEEIPMFQAVAADLGVVAGFLVADGTSCLSCVADTTRESVNGLRR